MTVKKPFLQGMTHWQHIDYLMTLRQYFNQIQIFYPLFLTESNLCENPFTRTIHLIDPLKRNDLHSSLCK